MVSNYGRAKLVFLALLSLLGFVGLTRDCIVTFDVSDPITDVSEIYESTVWIHNLTSSGETFAGTGWVVKTDKDHSYIMTAAHVVSDAGKIVVFHWPNKGGWIPTPGWIIHCDSRRTGGDVAIIMVPIKLKPLPIASEESFRVNDEVLVAGIQNQAPPALVAVGHIKKINRAMDRMVVNGWSWRGHSGGPVIHRKTKKIIGFVIKFASNDLEHASGTECSTFRIITEALTSAGL